MVQDASAIVNICFKRACGTADEGTVAVMASKRGRGANPDQTRRHLLDAAIAVLNRGGFTGATARAIAGEAGCNQASIYYHFGGIGQLLVAALVASNERRVADYQAALDPLDDPGQIITAWRELYAEDVRSGHIGAMSELLGATAVHPDLRADIVAVTRTWRELSASAIRRVVDGTLLEALVPVDEAAEIIMATVLGVELLGHIDGDVGRAERLFDASDALAALLPVLRGLDAPLPRSKD